VPALPAGLINWYTSFAHLSGVPCAPGRGFLAAAAPGRGLPGQTEIYPQMTQISAAQDNLDARTFGRRMEAGMKLNTNAFSSICVICVLCVLCGYEFFCR
jgi:hypothetical protein